MRSISVRGRFVLAAVSWLLGCGAAGEDPVDALEADDLGTMEQALNASCGSASPQATYTARVNPSLSASAAQQSAGCQGNSFIFDLNDYNHGMNPLLNPLLSPASIPTNEADCEATDLRFYVWEKTGSGVSLIGADIIPLVWANDPPFVVGCVVNSLFAPATLEAHHDYRMGVSVRRPSNTNQALVVTHSFAPQ